jgi:hypothetical protein
MLFLTSLPLSRILKWYVPAGEIEKFKVPLASYVELKASSVTEFVPLKCW